MAGRYELHEVLGTGAFATVHRATDPKLDASVAIKILADNWSRDLDIRRRFRSEAVLLRRVQSKAIVPGVVTVFDIDETSDGQPFIVMSYADLGTLRERAGRQSWSSEDVWQVVESVAASVGALHDAGVVHRDLKPSNLLLRSDRGATGGGALIKDGERLLVGDLGMAKDTQFESTALSFAGGSVRYMAPEQHTVGASIDHRADVHAASVIVAELLVGSQQLPAPGSPLEGQLPTSLPSAVRDVLNRGVATDPERRQQSLDEWRSELRLAFGAIDAGAPESTAGEQKVAAPPDKTSGRLKPAIVGVGALLVAALATVAVFMFGQDHDLDIIGPDEVVVGETSTFRLADGEDALWTDWTGAQITAPTLDITPILPGELSFSVARDSAQGDRSVDVVASALGPVINGPNKIRLGQQAVFTVTLPGDSVASYWIAPDGTRSESADLRFRPNSTGTAVVSMVSTDAAGVERGSRLIVDVGS